MPWKERNEKEVVDKNTSKFLSSVSIEFNREVKRKLTYEYLGIWTGVLRNTTGAIKQGEAVYFGVNTGYGYGFETGDWSKSNQYGAEAFLRKSGYSGETYSQYKKRNPQRASWTGDRRKRPFLKDTVNDSDVQSRIITRYKNAG